MAKAFAEGLIHKIKEGPTEPIYQPKVEKKTNVPVKKAAPAESKDVIELKNKLAEAESEIRALKAENAALKAKLAEKQVE